MIVALRIDRTEMDGQADNTCFLGGMENRKGSTGPVDGGLPLATTRGPGHNRTAGELVKEKSQRKVKRKRGIQHEYSIETIRDRMQACAYVLRQSGRHTAMNLSRKHISFLQPHHDHAIGM